MEPSEMPAAAGGRFAASQAPLTPLYQSWRRWHQHLGGGQREDADGRGRSVMQCEAALLQGP